MPPRPAPPPGQLSLLEWQPPAPVARFEDHRVRAATLPAQIARAIAEALRSQAEAGTDRAQIAERMGEYLGQRVSKSMLDAYASQAREDHAIPLSRFVALLHATADRRLLELIAEPLGWSVIDRRYLPLIELASVREHEDEVRRRAATLRQRARRDGVL